MIEKATDVARTVAKTVFATADVFVGEGRGPRIFIYHRIGEYQGSQLEVSPTNFKAQLVWLRGRGTIVSLEEAVAQRGHPKAHKLFVVTFDDGYADLFETAFPVLERDRIPFTLYLATEHVETGVALPSGGPPLTWKQIEIMTGSGLMTLGAHTHRHVDLRRYSTDQIEADLSACDSLIEQRIGITPRHFAYPWGYWSPAGDELVRARYETAALGAGAAINADSDPFLLHRLPIQRSDGLLFFRRKALRGMRIEETLRRALRGYRPPHRVG